MRPGRTSQRILRTHVFTRAATITALALADLAGCVDDADEELVPVEPPASDEHAPRKAILDTPEGVRTVTYRLVDGQPVVDDDILLPESVTDASFWAAPGRGPPLAGRSRAV